MLPDVPDGMLELELLPLVPEALLEPVELVPPDADEPELPLGLVEAFVRMNEDALCEADDDPEAVDPLVPVAPPDGPAG